MSIQLHELQTLLIRGGTNAMKYVSQLFQVSTDSDFNRVMTERDLLWSTDQTENLNWGQTIRND